MLVRSIRDPAVVGGARDSCWATTRLPQLLSQLSCQTHARSRGSCRQPAAALSCLRPPLLSNAAPTASCCDSLCHTSMGFSTNMPSARVLRPPTSDFVLFRREIRVGYKSWLIAHRLAEIPILGRRTAAIGLGTHRQQINGGGGIQGLPSSDVCTSLRVSCAQFQGGGEGVAPMRCEVRDRNVDRKGREENKELLSADIPVHPNNYSLLSAVPATPQVGSR